MVKRCVCNNLRKAGLAHGEVGPYCIGKATETLCSFQEWSEKIASF